MNDQWDDVDSLQDHSDLLCVRSAWREALTGSALALLEAPPTCHLEQATAAIAQLPATFSIHGHCPDRPELLRPETLSRVIDFVGRMLQNSLGLCIVRRSDVRALRNMCQGSHLGRNAAETYLLDVLMKSCFNGQEGYYGDGYVLVALTLLGVAGPDALSGHEPLLSDNAAAAEWALCQDFAWILPARQFEGRADDGARTCYSGHWGGVYRDDVFKSVAATDALSVAANPSALSEADTNVLRITGTEGEHRGVVWLVKESARVVVPHAGHSKACAVNYMRNYLFIGKEVVYRDNQAVTQHNLVTQPSGGSATQSELIKLAMPCQRMTGLEHICAVDARTCVLYAQHTQATEVTDYFFSGPFENQSSQADAGLMLPLLVQGGVSDMVIPPFFENNFVLAILKLDSSSHPASVYVADRLAEGCKNGDACCIATVQWVEQAFLKCPIVKKYCAMHAKQPAIRVEGLTNGVEWPVALLHD